MFGINIIAVGNKEYLMFAVNLAASIKAFRDIPIQLITSKELSSRLSPQQNSLFHVIDIVDDNSYYRYPATKQGFEPGVLKCQIYDMARFNFNLYIDADTICVSDFENLLLAFKNEKFWVSTIGKADIEVDNNAQMIWANGKQLRELAARKKGVMPATNSSMMYFEKCKQNERLFDDVKKIAMKAINYDLYSKKWGNALPDELPLNVALMKNDVILNSSIKGIQFSNNGEAVHAPFISFFMGQSQSKINKKEMYSGTVKKVAHKLGLQLYPKINELLKKKHIVTNA